MQQLLQLLLLLLLPPLVLLLPFSLLSPAPKLVANP